MNDQSKIAKFNNAVPTRNHYLDHADDVLGGDGEFLKFAKGSYFLGKDKRPVAAGTKFVADMDSYSDGYIKWTEGQPPSKRLRRINGSPRIDKNDLPDRDSDLWERDSKGEPIDPWKYMESLRMADPATGETPTFETTTNGGKKALARLSKAFGREMHLHPNEHPLIELLGGGGYEDSTRGWIAEPAFAIVGWIDKSADNLTSLDTPVPAQPTHAAPLVDPPLGEPPADGYPGNDGKDIRDPSDDSDIPF